MGLEHAALEIEREAAGVAADCNVRIAAALTFSSSTGDSVHIASRHMHVSRVHDRYSHILSVSNRSPASDVPLPWRATSLYKKRSSGNDCSPRTCILAVCGRVWKVNLDATGARATGRVDLDLREQIAMRAAADLTKSSCTWIRLSASMFRVEFRVFEQL